METHRSRYSDFDEVDLEQVAFDLEMWEFPKIGGSQYRPQHTMVLIGRPKMVPPVWETPIFVQTLLQL